MFYIKKIIKFVRDFLIDNILAKVFFLLPITDTIFIESVPNLSDSPKEIFDELLRRNFNEKYKSYNKYVMYDLQLTYRKTGMRGIVR